MPRIALPLFLVAAVALEINGVIQFAGISDANAPNSSLYYSTTANKLVYKDGGGTVQALW